MTYFLRLRSNGKEKRVIFLNFRQLPNTLHIHSSDRERMWPEAHCHVRDFWAFLTTSLNFPTPPLELLNDIRMESHSVAVLLRSHSVCRLGQSKKQAHIVRNDGQVLLEKMATCRTLKSNALYLGYQGVMAIGFD